MARVHKSKRTAPKEVKIAQRLLTTEPYSVKLRVEGIPTRKTLFKLLVARPKRFNTAVRYLMRQWALLEYGDEVMAQSPYEVLESPSDSYGRIWLVRVAGNPIGEIRQRH